MSYSLQDIPTFLSIVLCLAHIQFLMMSYLLLDIPTCLTHLQFANSLPDIPTFLQLKHDNATYYAVT